MALRPASGRLPATKGRSLALSRRRSNALFTLKTATRKAS